MPIHEVMCDATEAALNQVLEENNFEASQIITILEIQLAEAPPPPHPPIFGKYKVFWRD